MGLMMRLDYLRTMLEKLREHIYAHSGTKQVKLDIYFSPDFDLLAQTPVEQYTSEEVVVSPVDYVEYDDELPIVAIDGSSRVVGTPAFDLIISTLAAYADGKMIVFPPIWGGKLLLSKPFLGALPKFDVNPEKIDEFCKLFGGAIRLKTSYGEPYTRAFSANTVADEMRYEMETDALAVFSKESCLIMMDGPLLPMPPWFYMKASRRFLKYYLLYGYQIIKRAEVLMAPRNAMVAAVVKNTSMSHYLTKCPEFVEEYKKITRKEPKKVVPDVTLIEDLLRRREVRTYVIGPFHIEHTGESRVQQNYSEILKNIKKISNINAPSQIPSKVVCYLCVPIRELGEYRIVRVESCCEDYRRGAIDMAAKTFRVAFDPKVGVTYPISLADLYARRVSRYLLYTISYIARTTLGGLTEETLRTLEVVREEEKEEEKILS